MHFFINDYEEVLFLTNIIIIIIIIIFKRMVFDLWQEDVRTYILVCVVAKGMYSVNIYLI